MLSGSFLPWDIENQRIVAIWSQRFQKPLVDKRDGRRALGFLTFIKLSRELIDRARFFFDTHRSKHFPAVALGMPGRYCRNAPSEGSS